jgi:hypothetical protein
MLFFPLVPVVSRTAGSIVSNGISIPFFCRIARETRTSGGLFAKIVNLAPDTFANNRSVFFRFLPQIRADRRTLYESTNQISQAFGLHVSISIFEVYYFMICVILFMISGFILSFTPFFAHHPKSHLIELPQISS